mmetsp:Transcript_37523/g.62413  ORF Transcript_37523/g.62413 Transcript_37523/m.62413 type:complete len:81 (-) Transcript_37523:167-409(-)
MSPPHIGIVCLCVKLCSLHNVAECELQSVAGRLRHNITECQLQIVTIRWANASCESGVQCLCLCLLLCMFVCALMSKSVA